MTRLDSLVSIAELDVTVKEACGFIGEQQLLLDQQREWVQGKLDTYAEQLSAQCYGTRVNHQVEYQGKPVDNIYRVSKIRLHLKENGGVRFWVNVVRDDEPSVGNAFSPDQLTVWPEDT